MAYKNGCPSEKATLISNSFHVVHNQDFPPSFHEHTCKSYVQTLPRNGGLIYLERHIFFNKPRSWLENLMLRLPRNGGLIYLERHIAGRAAQRCGSGRSLEVLSALHTASNKPTRRRFEAQSSQGRRVCAVCVPCQQPKYRVLRTS